MWNQHFRIDVKYDAFEIPAFVRLRIPREIRAFSRRLRLGTIGYHVKYDSFHTPISEEHVKYDAFVTPFWKSTCFYVTGTLRNLETSQDGGGADAEPIYYHIHVRTLICIRIFREKSQSQSSVRDPQSQQLSSRIKQSDLRDLLNCQNPGPRRV